MFFVTSLDGSQVEPLINIGTDFKMEQSVDGTFTVSFSCFPSDNNAGYELLQSEAIVTIEDYEFKIKQFNKNAYSKTITGISTFFEYSKTRKDMLFSGSHTLINHLRFALSSTDWTFTVANDVANVTNNIPEFGEENIISMVEKICKYHQVEYIILPNNKLHFAKEVGGDYDYQYRYKHNLSDVVLTEDTSNLFTYIRGYGKDELTVEYSSPNIATFGKLEAEPIRDERFTDASSLSNYIKNQITDVPELAIESKIPELTSRETGERIWLIYEPLNVEMQTRILKQTKVLRNGALITESVVFGNTLIKSSVDLFIEHQQQIDDTKDNVDDAKKEYRSKFDQTDDRITLEVEQMDKSIAAIEIKADNINLSVNNRITNEMAAINLKADNINLNVNNRITNEVSAINIRSNNIELSVSNLERNTTSSINIMQNSISLKVDSNNIISSINLSPEWISINANKINLNGAVIVNGSISGATNISVTNDIYVGNNIHLAQYGYGNKSIIFDNTARIVSNGYSMDISAPSVRIGASTSFSGNVDFSNATTSNLSASNVRDFHLGYSTTGKLDVYRYGNKIGTVAMT